MIGSRSQDFVPIEDIKEGVVILKSGEYRSVIIASSLNLALKAEDEQPRVAPDPTEEGRQQKMRGDQEEHGASASRAAASRGSKSVFKNRFSTKRVDSCVVELISAERVPADPRPTVCLRHPSTRMAENQKKRPAWPRVLRRIAWAVWKWRPRSANASPGSRAGNVAPRQPFDAVTCPATTRGERVWNSTSSDA